MSARVPLNYPGDLDQLDADTIIDVPEGAIVVRGSFGGPPIGRVLGASVQGGEVLVEMDLTDELPSTREIVGRAELTGWGYDIAVRDGPAASRRVELREVVARPRPK